MKLFRKIRFQLLQMKGIKKYILYAIGEIILVVIGILIALQINNWNEHQKELAQEQLILQQLKSEYQKNLIQLEEKMLMRNQALESCNSLLKQIDNPKSYSPKNIYTWLAIIGRDPTFDPIKNDIIGSEKLRLIQNDSLVRFLSNWSSEVYQVQEIELDFKKFRTEIIFPWYIRLGIARNLHDNIWKNGYTPTEALDKRYNYKFKLNPSKRKIDFEKILGDVELEGIISQIITYHQITNIQSETLRSRIKEIIRIVESEIEE